MILKGNILITSDKNIIFQTINTMPDVKIISLTEDNDLNMNPGYFISGTVLLPPIDAVIAEIDGDEQKYDMIYYNHLSYPIVQEYMSTIIAFLYKGGKLLLYFPNEEYNNTMIKLLNFIMAIYGIHIGILGDLNYDNASCYFDANLEWYQLDLIYYYTGIIDWREYLYYYPIDVPINNQMVNLLMNQIKPYGDTYEQKLNVIKRLRVGIKEKPNLINPIMWRC
jgi:hypothetical protein